MLRLDMGGKVHYTKSLSKIKVAMHIFRYMKMILIPKTGPLTCVLSKTAHFMNIIRQSYGSGKQMFYIMATNVAINI